MLTDSDLHAIDKLIQKRTNTTVVTSEKRMMKHIDLKFNKIHKEFTKLFNFLDTEIVQLKNRVKNLEENDKYL